MAVSFFITGDVVPKNNQSETFKNESGRIFSQLKPYIAAANYAIANLEAPIIKGQPTPIKKSGPCLKTMPATVEALKEVGFNIVTLANNHFFDQGQNGVDTTIECCNLQNIKIVGGGKTYQHARKPLMLDSGEKKIAIINACENEFSIANSEHGGSNPLDLISIQEDIAQVRAVADYIIIIIHGGVEKYQYPTPRMKRWYRHFVDLGADVVINHHQHCINGYEVFKGKPIFYGLGNFYFPPLEVLPKQDSWNYGYAVSLILDKNIKFQLIPYVQNLGSITLRDEKVFGKEIELLNLPIKDDYLLQQKYDEFIIEHEYIIKEQLLPTFLRGRFFSGLARRGLLGKMYRNRQVLALKNRINCESHHEMLMRLFTLLTK